MFIRYAEAGALPVGAAVSAVRSSLKRRELRTRLPVLSLSILVLVIALIAALIALLPHQSNQALVHQAAMRIAPSHVEAAPLDVGLSPDDRSSASNSLAPAVAAFRWRHHSHHDRSHAFAHQWSVAAPDGNGEAAERPVGPSADYPAAQGVGDTSSGDD